MLSQIQRYFPNSKSKWRSYLFITIPVLFGAILYSLNSFVDNFMVGSVPGGAAALSAANSWTGLVIGVYTGVAYTGAIFIAQYYNKGEIDKAKQIQKLRININLFIAVCFSLVAWIDPGLLIKSIIGKSPTNIADIDSYNNIIANGISYIRIISITWIIIAMTSPISLSLAETGKGKYTFYISLLGLLANIIGNSIFIFILGLGVKGAAWASVIARLTTFSTYIIVMLVIKFKLMINPLRIFVISPNILKQFIRRSPLILFTSIFYFYIQARVPLFARGYPIGSIDHIPIGAINILGLAFAIMSIFLTAFSAIEANSANFVGKELGLGNLKQAVRNSDQLKGFNTLVAIFLSILMFGLSWLVPHMGFLAEKEPYKYAILKNVKYILWTICPFYPWWIWFVTSRINSMAGGKVKIQITINFIFGFIQLLFLALVMFVIVPKTHISFPLAFFIFFTSDIIYGILFEIAYVKMDWAKDITEEYS